MGEFNVEVFNELIEWLKNIVSRNKMYGER